MKTKPNVTVIGPGALGSSLLRALVKSGYEIASVISRNPAGETLQTGIVATELFRMSEADNTNLGQLVFIAAPDDSISDVAMLLSTLNINWPGRTVAHCSGFLTSGELASIREKGGSVASFHPLQTFVKGSVSDDFKNINISLEGGSEALHVLEKVTSDLGARPLFLDQDQKSMLHISAVFLSNYLVSLGGIADRLIQNSIPGRDVSLLYPLLLQTASNLAKSTPADALTGPVARGDVQTVRKHLETLSLDKEILKAYKLLGREAIRIAERDGDIIVDSISELRRLLRNE